MFRMVWKALQPPSLNDEYSTYTANILNSVLIVLGLGLLVLIAITPSERGIFPVLLIISIVTSLVLLHRKYLYLASMLFLGSAWFILTISSINYAGIHTPSFSAFVVIMILAGVLTGVQSALFFTALSILTSGLMVYLEVEGIITPQLSMMQPLDIWVTKTLIFVTASLIVVATSRSIRRAFSRLSHNEYVLKERNQKLEREIIERLQTEENLRQSQQKYHVLFEHTGIPAILFDEGLMILTLNAAAAKLLGGTTEQFINQPINKVYSEALQNVLLENILKVWHTGMGTVFEQKIETRKGTRYYLVDIQRIDDTNGKPFCIQMLTPEITDRKLSETRKLELAIAQERNAFLTDFLSTISHDIKTPLAVINTSLHLLKYLHEPHKQQERIQQIQQQADLVEKYLQDILTVSRLEYLPSLQPKLTAINELINQILNRFRPKIEKKALQLHLDFEEGIPPIHADFEQLTRAIVNLIENSINYTPNRGDIYISTRKLETTIRLEIADTGIGIRPEELPMIFERFYRAPQAREVEIQGTGLGLAIVKKIIDMHNYDLDVTSSLGIGTTFTVNMPITQTEAPTPQQ